DRAHREHAGNAPAVVGGGMRVGDRIERRLDLARRGGKVPRLEPRADEPRLRRIEAPGRGLGTADGEGEPAADAVGIEGKLARRRDQREIAAPETHLLEAGADPAGVATPGSAPASGIPLSKAPSSWRRERIRRSEPRARP